MRRPVPLSSERRIDVSGVYNVRDLGGHPAKDGRRTRLGRFVRADLLSGLPAESQETLLGYGIRTDVDLRTDLETELLPSSFAGRPGIGYHHHDLQGDPPPPGFDLGAPERSLAYSYVALMDARRSPVRDVLTTLCNGDGSAAVFFCAGGTDRAGIIAALLLAIAGVPDEAIAEGYSLSAQGLVDRFVAEGAPRWMSHDDLVFGRVLETLALPSIMIEMLQLVRQDFGGVESYLRTIGLTAAQIENLRDSFVE